MIVEIRQSLLPDRLWILVLIVRGAILIVLSACVPRKLGDLLMELLESMLLEIDLKEFIHFIALHAVNELANHLDKSDVLLALSLRILEL